MSERDAEPLRIRGITKADFDHIVTIFDRWWGGPSGERAHPLFFYELGGEALIAEQGGELVGFLLGFFAVGSLDEGVEEPSKTAYVHLVGIHPGFRRQGVGKELYQRFIERARSLGATRMKAITTMGNEGSVRFHSALGFEVHVVEDYAGPRRPRTIFTRSL